MNKPTLEHAKKLADRIEYLEAKLAEIDREINNSHRNYVVSFYGFTLNHIYPVIKRLLEESKAEFEHIQ